MSKLPLSERKIRTVQPTAAVVTDTGGRHRKLRTAAYCRVSTDSKEQEISFDSQVIYYTELINRTEDWEMAGIYADPAVSGTSRRHRQEFNRMLYDCLHGKIDQIITKSMSRFARNKLDALAVIRLLNGLHMVYIPSRFSNHYLKDDCLLISYGGKITEVTDPDKSVYERYEGWDERVWDSEIITILRGARKYSGYDIAPFIDKLKWKKEYMQETFPDEFAPERWNIDVDKMFEEESCPYCHVKLEEKSVMRCDANGGCDVLALCKECLRTWKWYRNAAGWSRDMEEYYFG